MQQKAKRMDADLIGRMLCLYCNYFHEPVPPCPRNVYFPPVIATPSMNCLWKIRYSTTIGSIARREPAISTG